jgi:phage major head subunit gpT-like protein
VSIITPAILTALNTGVKKNFQDGYNQMRAAAFWDQVATLVPSTTSSNTYGWLGDFPKLREWVGARVVRDMKASGYSIENKIYEATLGVQRTQIEDDQYGHFAPVSMSMGQEAAQHPDRLVQGVIAAGGASLCYDGQNFFDTDHPVYANEDGTGAVTTVSNVEAGAGAAWYLRDCSKVLKPFIFQERSKPELEMKFDPGRSDTVFNLDQYLWGIRYRCNAGYGFWQLARKSQAALDTAAFTAGRTAMRELKGDGGRPLGIVPNILMVPPALEAAADAIVNVRTLAGGGDNPNFGKAKVVVMDWV